MWLKFSIHVYKGFILYIFSVENIETELFN